MKDSTFWIFLQYRIAGYNATETEFVDGVNAIELDGWLYPESIAVRRMQETLRMKRHTAERQQRAVRVYEDIDRADQARIVE